MVVGIIIEENTLRVSTLDEMGLPIHAQIGKNNYLNGRLIIYQNHAYSEPFVDHVKLASPGMPICENLFLADGKPYQSADGSAWSITQMLAIVFKKIFFKLNSRRIQLVTQVNISFPPFYSKKQKRQIIEAIHANQIEKVFVIDYEVTIDNYLNHYHHPDGHDDQLISINLNEDSICIYGAEKAETRLASPLSYLNMEIKTFLESKDCDIEEAHPIDQLMFQKEIKTIYEDLLHDEVKPTYTFIVNNNSIKYVPKLTGINQQIGNSLHHLFKPFLSTDKKYFCSGRLIQFKYFQKMLSTEILTDASIVFDKHNEAKSKGILLGSLTGNRLVKMKLGSEFGFLKEIIIDNEVY